MTRTLTTLARTLTITLGLCSAALAGTVAGQSPYALESYGQQADAGTPPWVEALVAPANTVVEAIRWFGFHTIDSGGEAFDQFVVRLGGVAQTGALTHMARTDASGVYLFDEYTLDIADALLTATSLSVVNDSSDVAWFWQSAAAVGNPGAPSTDRVAFELIGHSVAPTPGVPEPATLPLLALALAALAGVHARRGRARW
jgi:hypothetical protein